MQTLEKPRKAWKNGPEKSNALQDEQRPSARGLDLKERLPFRLGLCEKKMWPTVCQSSGSSLERTPPYNQTISVRMFRVEQFSEMP